MKKMLKKNSFIYLTINTSYDVCRKRREECVEIMLKGRKVNKVQ
jgi:hypothetical protein